MSDRDPIEQFIRERDEVLLSLDIKRIRAHMLKYGSFAPSSDSLLLAAVHKARTAAKTLPREARLASKHWLEAKGLQSLDDGDLEGVEA